MTQLPMATQVQKHYPQNHLQSLLDGFCDFSGLEKCELSFKGLSLNSKKVHEEFLFLACAGTDSSQHGIAYAGEAIKHGASCIIWEPTSKLTDMPSSCEVQDKASVPLIKVPALRDKAGMIAARFYNHPSRAMTVIGVTGTNGKTSTTHFIAQLLHGLAQQGDADSAASGLTSNERCAVIGTLGNGVYGQLQQSTHTTPDAITLQALLADFRAQVKTVVMEVSSHALAQGRVNGIDFNMAVFTNLTRDHLDYHGDMQSYADEKLKLFQWVSLEQVIVNKDDAFSKVIIDCIRSQDNTAAPAITTCSRIDHHSDYFAHNISLGRDGIAFTLTAPDSADYPIRSHLVGDFNIDNLLAAIAAVHRQGYDMSRIVRAVAQINTVPGRMEKILLEDELTQAGQSTSNDMDWPLVVVDYAHTPDALEKGLIALRAHTQGTLFCVFGCGGDRDKGKRPLMARVAQRYSDQVMVTSDNPRTESVQQIISDIMQGFDPVDPVLSETDRQQAIYKILNMAKADDVVFIAGKGHEDYQEINGQRLPFSDKACVLSFYADGERH